MRNLLISIVLLTMLGVGFAAEVPEAVEKAIRAHGGESALRRVPLAVRTGTGNFTYFGKDLPFTDELVFDLPERIRLAVTIEKQPKRTWVLNGDKGWQSASGQTDELPSERVEEMREEAYVQWVGTLLPLKKDDFTLTAVSEAMVAGRPAVGIKAVSKGHGDVTLYFDKDTGLLVKMARRAREAGLQVDKEYLYSNHKEFDGAQLPTRVIETLNGKKFSELTSAKYQFLRSRDATLFDKP